jgi:mono/diheme cytochrome c family protein
MKSVSAICATGLLALALSGPAAAQDPAVGAELYGQFCATCHGSDATGNGPTAPILTLQPPDLTALSQRNDGVFPMQRVIDRIDGQEPLVAHGSPMPVYGPFFDGVQNVPLKAPSGQPVLVTQPIADLVSYLQAIQR